MDQLLYGAAYYDEYMPYERLDKRHQYDEKRLESTSSGSRNPWSTEEPEEGVFDFSHNQSSGCL